MDHITNDTSLIEPCDVIPVGAQNPRFPVVGHRYSVFINSLWGDSSCCNVSRGIFRYYIKKSPWTF